MGKVHPLSKKFKERIENEEFKQKGTSISPKDLKTHIQVLVVFD
jgi:hypothetical protein